MTPAFSRSGGPMDQISAWLQIMALAPKAQSFSDQKKLDWLLSSVLDGYVATMDCPAATLTPEIMRVYPDAIVIATTRDEKSWWNSMVSPLESSMPPFDMSREHELPN